MAVQTVYNETQPAGVAGAQATMIPATIISRNVENAAGIGFGVAVAQGAAAKGIVPFGTGATTYVGFTLLDRSAEGTPTTPDGFGQRDSARVITKGDLWVNATVAVTAGQPVYLVAATGVVTNVSTGNTAVPNAMFDTTTTAANQLAVIRLG